MFRAILVFRVVLVFQLCVSGYAYVSGLCFRHGFRFLFSGWFCVLNCDFSAFFFCSSSLVLMGTVGFVVVQ